MVKYSSPKKIIISAVSENGVIGLNGKIPWHSREEFKHFKGTTIGHTLIMGRKTFESLGKPLKNREHLIITRNRGLRFHFEGLQYFGSLKEAYDYCHKNQYEKVFIIGGGKIYDEAINEADMLIISVMKITVKGDTFFPKIDSDVWKVSETKEADEFTVFYYTRKNQ